MNKKLLIIVGIGVILIVIVLFFMDSIIALFTGGSDVQVTQNIQLSQQRRARQQQAQVQKAEEETERSDSLIPVLDSTAEILSANSLSFRAILARASFSLLIASTSLVSSFNSTCVAEVPPAPIILPNKRKARLIREITESVLL